MDGGMRGIDVFFHCTATGNHRQRLGAHSCKHPSMKHFIETEIIQHKHSLLVQQHDSQSATGSPVIAQRFFSAGSTSLRLFRLSSTYYYSHNSERFVYVD